MPADRRQLGQPNDNAGNMTTDETGRTFTYDAWNRLIKVSGTTRYAYDALGRPIKEGSTELYYSKDWQVLEERNSSNAPVARYVWSPVYVDAMVLRDRDTNGDGTLDERLFAAYDANYNVTALVQINFSASVVERYLYDPYGRFDVKDASWGTRSGSSYAWVYLHQGGRWDATEGMYNFRNRDYSPTLMRWNSEDPLQFQADVNFFRYLGNDPTVFTDPLGLGDWFTTPRGVNKELEQEIQSGVYYGWAECRDGEPVAVVSDAARQQYPGDCGKFIQDCISAHEQFHIDNHMPKGICKNPDGSNKPNGSIIGFDGTAAETARLQIEAYRAELECLVGL